MADKRETKTIEELTVDDHLRRIQAQGLRPLRTAETEQERDDRHADEQLPEEMLTAEQHLRRMQEARR
jgi:hypothetical protein